MKSRELAEGSPFEVQNQSTALEDYNLFSADQPFREACETLLQAEQVAELDEYGATLGRAEWLEAGREANIHEPELILFDRFGHRENRVRFHDSYHRIMELSIAHGGHSEPWESARPGRFASRAAKMYLKHQIEQGTSCPVTMTFAAIPSLRVQPDVTEQWVSGALTRSYDPRLLPREQKKGLLFGMAMTERQGGSDVRANATRATPETVGGPGEAYRVTGHKWFCSAPMSDAFLALAQTKKGLSCFLVPRMLPDGTQNALEFLRLKDKLGNRSNASSEVIFRDAYGQLIGEEGRGVATIIEMVRHTRLDCVIGAASLIRRCVAEALHHARGRYVFSRLLIEQPLMKNVLADLCVESEAAAMSSLVLSDLYERAQEDQDAARLSRLATAVVKYWSTKRETAVAREALECLGGNGYIEESPMPRLFRESPLNSIWEGSGNVQCLDVLRAIQRDPASFELFSTFVRQQCDDEPAVIAALDDVAGELKAPPEHVELGARRLVEKLGLAFQAATLRQLAPTSTYETFVRTRLAGDSGHALGTLPVDVPFDELISRNMPGIP